MRAKMLLTIMSGLSLLFSASVSAHFTEPGTVLPHIFTGEHLLLLVTIGVCIAGASKIYRHFR